MDTRVMFFVLTVLCISTVITAKSSTETYTCPKSWLLNKQTCYRYGNDTVTFSLAETQCQTLGGRLRLILKEEDTHLFQVTGPGNVYWLGIQSSDDVADWWYIVDGETHYVSYTPSPNRDIQQQYGYPRQRLCATWNSVTGSIKAVLCEDNTRRPFMCQKEADLDCVPGWFGVNCSQACHCSGETCNTTTGHCSHGCQLGWSGTTCSSEKVKAEAKFYCLKIRNQNVMLFRLNQRGTNYRYVAGNDKYNTKQGECGRTQFNFFEDGGMATLKVRQHENGKFSPACGEIMESADTYSWRFTFKEFPMTSSAYDIQFELTCDFSTAETLERSVTFNTDKPSNKTTKLTKSHVFVTFDLVDPVNFRPMTSVKLGQQIQLQMKLTNGDDYGITAISPYNCSVSADGEQTLIFLDENGCTPEESQIRFNSSDLSVWRSDRFEAFTFQGHDKVNFQCDVHVCFSEKHGYCKDMCTHTKKRRNRKLRKRRRGHSSQKLGSVVHIET